MKIRQDAFAELRQLSLGLPNIEVIDEDIQRLSPDEALRVSEAARLKFEGMRAKTQYQDGKRFWYEDYLELCTLFPWRVAAWIAWAASPKTDRWPRTQEELATEVLGLNSDRAIGNWRKKYPDIDTALAVMQAAPLMEHRRDVFEALAYSASQLDHRSNPDRKLFLEMTGDYQPRMTLDQIKNLNVQDLSEMDEAELRDIGRAVIDGLIRDKQETDGTDKA